jgi:ferric-dicitrate binding protein FerR (iron transport regulator)
MTNPLRDEWLHGPDADPDPTVAEAVALITEYQLGLLSDLERAAVERRLITDQPFAEIVTPILMAAHVMRARKPARATPREHTLTPPKRHWIRQHVTVWRIAASLLGFVILTSMARTAYGAILRARLAPASVTFTNTPLSVVMAELRRRYHIDVEVCDRSATQDRVTMTLTDAPVDDVVEAIAQQTLRRAHWTNPYVLRFQPEPDIPRGWMYNLRVVARWYTTLGCHR